MKRSIVLTAVLGGTLLAAPLAQAATASTPVAPAAPTAAAATPAAPTMVVNASSPYSNIMAVQYLLAAWGVPTTADGSFGPGTTASIRTFQSKKGLSADGLAGPLTMKALTNTPGFAGSPNHNTTKAVQRLLVKIGYSVSVDGSFGPATTAAVKAYQHRIGVAETGKVDATTWAFLFEPKTSPGSSSGWKACSDSIRGGIPISQTGVATNGIRVAKCLVPDVNAMVAAAAKSGVTIKTASDWRSLDSQIALRKKDCGTSNYDIYQKPPAQCNPNTAIPGTSIHEFGLALDVTAPGLAWMLAHGGTYGFHHSVHSEPWHFDTKYPAVP